ncbi:MAG: S8 family serine peptidase [Geminicoccaceae bacterium]
MGDYLPSRIGIVGEQRLIPFLLRFNDDVGPQAFRRLLTLLETSESQIFVADIYRRWLEDKTTWLRSIVCVATKQFFDELAVLDSRGADLGRALLDFRDSDKCITLGEPFKTPSLAGWTPPNPIPPPLPDVAPPPQSWPAETVVMGVIDDGMAIANVRFRERDPTSPTASDRSRFQFLWHMDEPDSPPMRWRGFGFELAKHDTTIPGMQGIDSLLDDCTTPAGVDEDRFYREARLIDFNGHVRKHATARRASHGAHVLDLAAGEDPDVPEGRRRGAMRPIIGVQLPVSTVEDTSGASLAPKLIEALDYIIARADAIARAQPGADPNARLPIVVNCSYGFIAGPHDGKSALELAMDQRVSDRDDTLRIVLPSGNSNLSRCHAAFEFEPRETKELRWRVQPDDRTLSYVEIWLPEGFDPATSAARVHLSIETPFGLASFDGPTGAALEEGDSQILVLQDDVGAILALAAYAFRAPVDPDDSGRGMFIVMLQPTARLQPASHPTAASGLWTIRLHNQHLDAGEEVQAWIQRDDTPFGYPVRGRQSYFDEACYQRFADQTSPIGEAIADDSHADQDPCHVQRAGLINAIATGTETVVVGGFNRTEEELADYSAGGAPLPRAPIRAPDISAISDDSRVHIGVMATGTRSGSKIALNGTSVAAPKIARLIAEHLSSSRLPGRPPSPPPDVCSLPSSLVPLSPPERAGCGGVLDEDIPGLPIVRRP